jgi:polyhydroxybutyrate depolymerase
MPDQRVSHIHPHHVRRFNVRRHVAVASMCALLFGAAACGSDSASSGSAGSGCAVPTPGVHDALLPGPGNPSVRVFVPSARTGALLPTVIDWHASGEDEVREALVTGYEAVAEREGFIVVHPAHTTPGYWVSERWQTDSAGLEADDITYANALIDELVANWCADPARVYSTGFSLGAQFTSRLVCVLSDRLAGAASIAGVFHTDDCKPSRAVPFIAFHGTSDQVLPYDETVDAEFGGDPAFLAQKPFDEFQQFAVDAGCTAPSTDADLSDEIVQHNFTGGTDGIDRTFYEIVGGGHSWPGSQTAELGYTTEQINATEVSWAYFKSLSLPSVAPGNDATLTVDSATAVANSIVSAFNAVDVAAINAIVGDSGTWISIRGKRLDHTNAGSYLKPLLDPIDSTERIGDPTPIPGGFSFPLREHVGTSTTDYFIFVYLDPSGAQIIQESFGSSPTG